MDATAVEQVEIARLNLDLLLFNLILCGVFVVRTIGEVRPYLGLQTHRCIIAWGLFPSWVEFCIQMRPAKLVCKTETS